MDIHEKTKEILKNAASEYALEKLTEILNGDKTLLYEKDIYICLKEIVEAAESETPTLEALEKAVNIYQSPIFLINNERNQYNIKKKPDFKKAIKELGRYSFCFKLSPYHIINTYLAIIEAQITGIDLKELCQKGIEHIEESIERSLKINPNWHADSLMTANPQLIVPVGAAGCGKSTLYFELSNVINLSCDNIRYLLFRDHGPCFSPWESCLSWWVVNYLTDNYLQKGYNVFYNGVNTDLEYRSPITMEDPDILFAGMPYKTKLVYFKPSIDLTREEQEELKSINLWKTPIDKIDDSGISENVAKIMSMIRNNYDRTISRTKAISEGRAEQDPFDILYAVPAPVVKLFVEQSFDKPADSNLIVIEWKDLPDPEERNAFYREYAKKILS